MMECSQSPVVSIVTVVFNGATELRKTAESVISLNYPHVEYIVIDGGSTDGSVDIIKSLGSKVSHFVSEPDKGIYDAMNKGIRAATGEWINFMNCGDSFYSANALDFFKQPIEAGTDIIYGDAMVKYNTFEGLAPTHPVAELWKQMPFCHQATFVKASLMKSRGFDLHYRLSSDFNFFYQSFLAGARFQYVPEVVCHFDYTQGASVKNALLSTQERKQIVLRAGFDWKKWLYYSIQIGYVRASIIGKKLLGKRLSEWIIRNVKR